MGKFDLKHWLKNRRKMIWRDLAKNLILQFRGHEYI